MFKTVELVDVKEDWITPVNGIITSSCGSRTNPVLNKQEIHDGLDIAVESGTAVAAVKSGVVTEVRRSPTYGIVVKFSTSDGYEIFYAHLSKALVKAGDSIKQGDIIAESGNTGLSTGPHLHYGIKKDGGIVDPMDFVDLPYTAEVKAEYAARGDSVN